VTTPAQTIADLQGAVSHAQHRRAVRQAEVFGLATGLAAGEATRSELEDLFLRLCRRHHLPTPEVNVRVGGHEVDFLWRPQRLIVETDGYRFHRGSAAFESDHDRDLTLRAHGFSVIRLTYRQVTAEPTRIAALLCEELQR
jgi:very-short-patch-repair endonuclease